MCLHICYNSWPHLCLVQLFMIKPTLSGGSGGAYQQGGFLLRLLQGQLSRPCDTAHVWNLLLSAGICLCVAESWTASVHEQQSANMVSTQPLHSVCAASHRAAHCLSHHLTFT